ncbi:hypothetical protein K443DRAFT_679874 [Laccaria amethystina LaAM-08-1]|uniref:Uncharacterized protein n=1 Tax=Laccaria amethystina LaAM-08-1 TaxID=1095629 RepID=A0A0C9XUF3_9AGAR|nr:hypothetical protein K443DRAFT_679874 [Laccaria amethystina LaAM-08-1]
MPQSADIACNDLARPSSDQPILITLSSTIPVADMALPITGYRAGVPSEREVERLQQAIPIPSGLLSSYPPTSPLIASVMDAGLRSVDTEMAVAFNQAEGPLQEAVDCLQQSTPILTGPCSLQIYIFSF